CSFIEALPPKTVKRPSRKPVGARRSKKPKKQTPSIAEIQVASTSSARSKRKSRPTKSQFPRYKEKPDFLKLTSEEELSESSESSHFDIDQDDDLDHQPLF